MQLDCLCCILTVLRGDSYQLNTPSTSALLTAQKQYLVNVSPSYVLIIRRLACLELEALISLFLFV